MSATLSVVLESICGDAAFMYAVINGERKFLSTVWKSGLHLVRIGFDDQEDANESILLIPIQERTEKVKGEKDRRMNQFLRIMDCYDLNASRVSEESEYVITTPRIKIPTTFYFEDKTSITMENFQIEFHLPKQYLGPLTKSQIELVRYMFGEGRSEQKTSEMHTTLQISLEGDAPKSALLHAEYNGKKVCLSAFKKDGFSIKLFDPYCGFYDNIPEKMEKIYIRNLGKGNQIETNNDYMMERFLNVMGCFDAGAIKKDDGMNYIITTPVIAPTRFYDEKEAEWIYLRNFKIVFHLPKGKLYESVMARVQKAME